MMLALGLTAMILELFGAALVSSTTWTVEGQVEIVDMRDQTLWGTRGKVTGLTAAPSDPIRCVSVGAS
jgi:hypothetical protein